MKPSVYCNCSVKMDRLSTVTMWSIFLFLCVTSLTNVSVCASRVELVNNEYVNLVVAITEAAPVDQSNQIIDNIKKIIREASPILHQATDDRAIFKKVTIIIPQSWDHINTLTATWETVEEADIRIDAPIPEFGETPATLQSGKCGEPGKRIHLTPSYVASINLQQNLNRFGKPGKVFVHEWAHYRYGIFNEYGSPNDPNFPLFYRSPKDSKILPNVCADVVPNEFSVIDISNNSTTCNTDPVTQIYDKNCRFLFPKSYKPKTSLSSWHQIDSVVHFCNDDNHNSDAPNKQNMMCNQKSAWSIIESHRDFANGANSGRIDFESHPTIEFQILKAIRSLPRFIVVTDVSKSMSDFDRIDKLRQAVQAWIKNDVPKGSKVGMVQFSSEASIVSNLTEITDMNSRQNLMDKVPKDLIGATCIGCGLDLAMKMVKESNETGVIFVLITDGKNTEGRTSIDDVSENIKAADVRVVTIAFGPKADANLEKLADLTGGKSYYIRDENTNGQAIRDAFLGALTYQSTISNSDLEFKLIEKQITKSENFQFYVDHSVGRNLKLSIYDLDPLNNVKIKLIGPNGQVTEKQSANSNTAVDVTVDIAEAGNWTSEVKFDNVVRPVTVVVTTQLLEKASTPITTRCWIPNGANILNATNDPIRIYAEVRNGSYPVIRADVKAYIVMPDGEVEILDLFDNGNEPDGKKDDGEYSRYFIKATQQGRYIVSCQIVNSGTALQTNGFIGSANPDFSHDMLPNIFGNIPLEKFSRVASGGSFKVRTPVPMDDPYPPGDVRDLSVSLVNQSPTNVSVELQWTAPGDDLDSGIVSFYELKYSDDETDLLDSNFDENPFGRQSRSVIMTDQDLIAGSLLPNQAGTPQSATFLLVNVPRGKNCYIALRAVDKSHKVSHVSNFGVFFITNDQDSTDMILIVSKNESAGAHVVSVMVAGFGLILIVSFSILLLTSIFRGITSKSSLYSVVSTNSKSPV